MTLLDIIAEIRHIQLNQVSDDPATQPREKLDDATVERYADAMAAGQQLPPITVYHDGETYWLADGWHRREAARRLMRASIEAEVRRGTRRDAILFAAGANETHGLPRSNEDKRRAVLMLLHDEEWSKWSDHEIARACKVSQPFVSKLRSTLSDNGYQMTQTRLARRGGQVYEQRVRAPEPEPTEAEIEIARDLVVHAISYWKRPANLGYIYNAVQRDPDGGARTTKKAVKAALYRMIQAGTVVEMKDNYNRTVYALAKTTPSAVDELNARFDRDAITILGRSDDGAEHRAIEIARRLVAAGVWDGQEPIQFNAYALHDKLFGVNAVEPADLLAGPDGDYRILDEKTESLKARILDLIAVSPLPAPILCERLGMGDKRAEVDAVLAELKREKRASEFRSMWFATRNDQRQMNAEDIPTLVAPASKPAPDNEQPVPASPEAAKRAILEALAAGPCDLIAKRQTGWLEGVHPAKFSDYTAELIEVGAIRRLGMTGALIGTYELVPDTAAQSQAWLDQQVSRGAPDNEQPTPTAKDAERIRELLKKHAPVPLRLKYIREQLDLSETAFTRARMLLLAAGDVVQSGDNLKLADNERMKSIVIRTDAVTPEMLQLHLAKLRHLLDDLAALADSVTDVAQDIIYFTSKVEVEDAGTCERIAETQVRVRDALNALTGLCLALEA